MRTSSVLESAAVLLERSPLSRKFTSGIQQHKFRCKNLTNIKLKVTGLLPPEQIIFRFSPVTFVDSLSSLPIMVLGTSIIMVSTQ